MYESQGTADDQTEIWTELFKLIDDDDGQLTAQVCFLMSQKKSGHLNNLQFSFFCAGARVYRGESGREHQ